MTTRPRIQTRTLRGTPRNLAFLAARLRLGDLVAVPTETVYGLAANALDPRACRAIFQAKRRPTADPLIVHVHDIEQLDDLCVVNEAARKLGRAFWPGPLTLVLPKKAIVPGIVTADRASVALRIPAHRLFRALLKRAGLPLAAPSANPFGYVSPTTAAHVSDGLAGRIPFILDGGPCRIGVESTIVDLRDPDRPQLLRPGAVGQAELEKILGQAVPAIARSARPNQALIAPGLLARHYSPRARVVLHAIGTMPAAPSANEALLYLRPPPICRKRDLHWLDARGNLRGAARRLFAKLRELDQAGFTCIHVELAPGNDGLAAAINDRLRRAAAR